VIEIFLGKDCLNQLLCCETFVGDPRGRKSTPTALPRLLLIPETALSDVLQKGFVQTVLKYKRSFPEGQYYICGIFPPACYSIFFTLN
jgi:hypothetical protein